MLTFSVAATRSGPDGSTASAKSASLSLDTSLAGRADALNPVELLLASQAACFIKGVERLAPTLNFEFSSVRVELEADRPEAEARIAQLRYRIEIDTNESDHRLELLHKNLKKNGTIFNTLSAGTEMVGTISRLTEARS